MARPTNIEPKKQPKQRRSIVTVDAIVEAATYILRRGDAGGLTTNKVAERAGVNIASFYQYFPNKEALIFHIVRLTWERQLARLRPILTRPDADHAANLRDFIREFFLIEAAEVDLRRALRNASIDLRETAEFKELISAGVSLIRDFLRAAVADQLDRERDFAVHFMVLLVTSFAERTTDEGTSGFELIRQADVLADMLIAQFRIG